MESVTDLPLPAFASVSLTHVPTRGLRATCYYYGLSLVGISLCMADGAAEGVVNEPWRPRMFRTQDLSACASGERALARQGSGVCRAGRVGRPSGARLREADTSGERRKTAGSAQRARPGSMFVRKWLGSINLMVFHRPGSRTGSTAVGWIGRFHYGTTFRPSKR